MQYAPGMRLLIRDAEWWLKRVDLTQTGHHALSVTGLSEIVRGKEAVFLTAAEEEIQVLKPEKTVLVADDSPHFLRTRLHLESQLRRMAPIGHDLWIGHRGAMDLLPFQLDPAFQALKQPRPRILIADTVGLGKTLEAGILVSELIRRGRAKRILVVTVKSVLAQFQKEWWSRFTIPLVRLDSIGLQRVRNKIPTHQNPFYFFDRSIISIDTLKQDNEFRNHLERAYWDVIVIDEAHNVAKRGSSQRHKLAQLLATRSDSLIMLSATPHDGSKKSFASLMNMLDSTAISDEENYGPEDIRGLYVRRFRKDVADQLRSNVPDRKMDPIRSQASPAEQEVFRLLESLKLSTDRFPELNREAGGVAEPGAGGGSGLFRTTLLKAFLSSPDACLETVAQRLTRLEKGQVRGDESDRIALTMLRDALLKVDGDAFSKFGKLLQHLKTWKPKDDDRVVIFTERIATLKMLAHKLPQALGLAPEQIALLHGTMEDTEMTDVVEDFGQQGSKIRLLLASDVASEGINLHFQCHRLIHFDIPWSLMVFAQRNGRIDRYGQRYQPIIAYLLTCDPDSPRSDERVLQLLMEKDRQAHDSIGDPSALLGVFTQPEQEDQVAQAIETGNLKSIDKDFGALDFDPFEVFLHATQETDAKPIKRTMPSLFRGDYAYCSKALDFLASEGETLQYAKGDANQELWVTLTEEVDTDDLASRFDVMPREARPVKGPLHLSTHPKVVQNAIEAARNKDGEWPKTQYLWPLHPVVEWIDDRVQAAFGRMQAPVVLVPGLRPNETLILVSGLYPNRLGHPLVHRWLGVRFADNRIQETLDLEAGLALCGLNQDNLVNAKPAEAARCESLQALLLPALQQAAALLAADRKSFQEQARPELEAQEKRLTDLLGRHDAQIEIDFGKGLKQVAVGKKEARRQEIRSAFAAHRRWLNESHHLEEHAHFTILAVCTGA